MFTRQTQKAVIRPLLKNPKLDHHDCKNFRPISNLTILSKVVQKVVAKQLVSYLESNDLCEVFQSEYRKNHSTETTLIRVYSDIATAIDKRRSVILVLLDLSAAFHTVDHSRLLEIRVSQNLAKLGEGCTAGRNFGGISICV